MKKKEVIGFIEKTLDSYFPDPKIPLKHTDPFTLLVATVLSAQATDAKVNEVNFGNPLFKPDSVIPEVEVPVNNISCPHRGHDINDLSKNRDPDLTIPLISGNKRVVNRTPHHLRSNTNPTIR